MLNRFKQRVKLNCPAKSNLKSKPKDDHSVGY